MVSLATFNANNLFIRYRFKDSYPGDRSKKSKAAANKALGLGYLPGLPPFATAGDVVIWDEKRRKSTAQALKTGDGKLPDVLCLQEVESMAALRLFNRRQLNSHYKYLMLIDSYDERLIDVGVMSIFPFTEIRSNVDLKQGKSRVFSRDCLEVAIDLGGSALLHLFVNHLKSKLVTGSGAKRIKSLREAHAKRKLQAETVKDLVTERFKGKQDTALYAVIGDFNDTPTSPSVAPLTQNPLLKDVLTELLPPLERYTYYWRSRNRVSQIDYILASRALFQRIKAAAADPKRAPRIERSGISFKLSAKTGKPLDPKFTFFEPDEAHATDALGQAPAAISVNFNFKRFASVQKDPLNPISDHVPVKVWF